MSTHRSYKAILQSILAVILAISAASVSAGVKMASGPMPYSMLAAHWWQWAFETPTSINPVIDDDGEFCAVNQKGDIWFLAGTFGGEVERWCTVPAGKSLFFPTINCAYFAFLTDHPKNIPFDRFQAAICRAGIVDFWASVDNQPVTITHERSIPFVVRLPDDNILGATPADIKNLMLAPSVDEGDYVLVSPLTPGEHTIIFGNRNAEGNVIQATYHLTIE